MFQSVHTKIARVSIRPRPRGVALRFWGRSWPAPGESREAHPVQLGESKPNREGDGTDNIKMGVDTPLLVRTAATGRNGMRRRLATMSMVWDLLNIVIEEVVQSSPLITARSGGKLRPGDVIAARHEESERRLRGPRCRRTTEGRDQAREVNRRDGGGGT